MTVSPTIGSILHDIRNPRREIHTKRIRFFLCSDFLFIFIKIGRYTISIAPITMSANFVITETVAYMATSVLGKRYFIQIISILCISMIRAIIENDSRKELSDLVLSLREDELRDHNSLSQ
jgi:hypothetical protein